MKIAINILKGILLILTAIWGLMFGVLGSFSILTGDVVPVEISSHPIIIVWLINSIVCLIGGTVIVMMGHTKIASVVSTVGFIVVLIIYANFAQLYSAVENSDGPVSMYMPAIFITIITYIIALLSNWNLIKRKLEETSEKKHEDTPSVLGGTYSEKKK